MAIPIKAALVLLADAAKSSKEIAEGLKGLGIKVSHAPMLHAESAKALSTNVGKATDMLDVEKFKAENQLIEKNIEEFAHPVKGFWGKASDFHNWANLAKGGFGLVTIGGAIAGLATVAYGFLPFTRHSINSIATPIVQGFDQFAVNVIQPAKDQVHLDAQKNAAEQVMSSEAHLGDRSIKLSKDNVTFHILGPQQQLGSIIEGSTLPSKLSDFIDATSATQNSSIQLGKNQIATPYYSYGNQNEKNQKSPSTLYSDDNKKGEKYILALVDGNVGYFSADDVQGDLDKAKKSTPQADISNTPGLRIQQGASADSPPSVTRVDYVHPTTEIGRVSMRPGASINRSPAVNNNSGNPLVPGGVALSTGAVATMVGIKMGLKQVPLLGAVAVTAFDGWEIGKDLCAGKYGVAAVACAAAAPEIAGGFFGVFGFAAGEAGREAVRFAAVKSFGKEYENIDHATVVQLAQAGIGAAKWGLAKTGASQSAPTAPTRTYGPVRAAYTIA